MVVTDIEKNFSNEKFGVVEHVPTMSNLNPNNLELLWVELS